MRNFRQLSVWQKSYALTIKIYQISSDLPKTEAFGLNAQIRRACVSIPANIAEGCGYESNAQFKRYLTIALGSAYELDCHIMISKGLGFISEENYIELHGYIDEIQKMLFAFIKSIKSST